jgi:glycosyltransferase 2 family protein
VLGLLKKKQFWGALIGLLLLGYCLKGIRLAEIRDLWERVTFEYLFLAIVMAFLYIAFRVLRWRIMILRQAPITLPRAFALYSAAQVVNIIMPMLTGQVGRLMLFAKKLSVRKSYVFSTMVLEVLFDAVSLIIFMFFTSLAFAFPSEYRAVSFIVAVVTTVVLVGFYLMLHYQRPLEECGRRWMAGRWPGVYIAVKKFMRSFTKGIDLLRSSQHLAVSILYSLLSWVCHMFVIYALFKAFGLELPVAAAAVIMIINTIVLMVPITPGNAGTFEVAVSASLGAFSQGRTDAVLFALALHILDLLPVLVLGAAYFHFEKVSLAELKKTHEDELIFQKIDEDGSYIEEDRP